MASGKDRPDRGGQISDQAWERYRRGLQSYVRTILCSPADAEDVVQNVFLAFSRVLAGGAVLIHPRSYLYRMARHEALRWARRKRARSLREHEAATGGPDVTEMLEVELDVQRVLARVPLGQREVLVLRLYDRMTFEEIGELTGVSLNTAASRYRYGLARIKKLLPCDDERRFAMEMTEDPDPRKEALGRAETLYADGRLDQAIEAYGRIAEQYPDWNYAEHALMMIGICHEHAGDLENARRALRQAVLRYPALEGFSETTRYYLGEVCRRLGLLDEAREHLRRAIDLCAGTRAPDSFPVRDAVKALRQLSGP